MAINSPIEWTETTWNPCTGCTQISRGCKHCYAMRMANRLQAMGQPNYANGFKPTVHPHMLNEPLKWKSPRLVFVNSMSDLFHKDIPSDFILSVFNVMCKARQHTFQVLTKRPERLLEMDKKLSWQDNIWMGVTVEDRGYTHRIDLLRKTGAHVKFLSLEPLLGPINVDLMGIHWVIVGGESGPGARPMEKSWVTEIRDKCVEKKIPFFFKQWGGVHKKKAGRVLDGKIWSEMPTLPDSSCDKGGGGLMHGQALI